MINFSEVNQPMCVYFEATIPNLLSTLVHTNYLELIWNAFTAKIKYMWCYNYEGWPLKVKFCVPKDFIAIDGFMDDFCYIVGNMRGLSLSESKVIKIVGTNIDKVKNVT